MRPISCYDLLLECWEFQHVCQCVSVLVSSSDQDPFDQDDWEAYSKFFDRLKLWVRGPWEGYLPGRDIHFIHFIHCNFQKAHIKCTTHQDWLTRWSGSRKRHNSHPRFNAAVGDQVQIVGDDLLVHLSEILSLRDLKDVWFSSCNFHDVGTVLVKENGRSQILQGCQKHWTAKLATRCC